MPTAVCSKERTKRSQTEKGKTAACLLSWCVGMGSGDEKGSAKLVAMLQDLGEWFEGEINGRFESTKCKDIVGDMVGTPEGEKICSSVQRGHEPLAPSAKAQAPVSSLL